MHPFLAVKIHGPLIKGTDNHISPRHHTQQGPPQILPSSSLIPIATSNAKGGHLL